MCRASAAHTTPAPRASPRRLPAPPQDLARAGHPPVVLVDCLRFLATRGLTARGLFGAPVDRRRLLALKEAYEGGRRAARGARAAHLAPADVANLLLLWLGSLPEPPFPAELAAALAPPAAGRGPALAALRAALKRAEPFVVEALFPLFELLHHWWLNQPGRGGAATALGELFQPLVFGPDGAPPGLAALAVAEYRPLFTQPYDLRRYEADAARQAAAAAVRAAARDDDAPTLGAPLFVAAPTLALALAPSLAVRVPRPGAGLADDCDWMETEEGGSGAQPWSPLLTPRRLGGLSVMYPDRAASPSSSPETPPGAWLGGGDESAHGAAPGAPEADADLERVLEALLGSTVAAAFAPAPARGAAKAGCGQHRRSPTSVLDEAESAPSDMSGDADGADDPAPPRGSAASRLASVRA
jgi:hypothetical protein